MRCALRDMRRRERRLCPEASSCSTSALKRAGSRTTPLPMMLTLSPWNIPEGMERRTYFCPSNSSVCPAFGPPWKRVTAAYRGVRTSTTLPLPSSPHCRPNRTSTFII